MSRLVYITVGLILFMAAGLAGVAFIISNFENLSDEDFVAETNPGYVAIDGLSAPVSVDRALDHYVLIDLRLEVADERRIDEVVALLPRIRDQIMRDLHRNSGGRADGIGSIDLLRLKASALVLANQVLGENMIKAVLITSVAKAVA